MEIQKTIVKTSEDGSYYLIDTVTEDGRRWLVPQWVEKGCLAQRMICIEDFRPKKARCSPDGVQRAHYYVEEPLPCALLDGSELGDLAFAYEVREGDGV